MTAIGSAGRNTPIRANSTYLNRASMPMAAATTIPIGAGVCLNAAGFLVNASTATTLKTVGILGDQPFEVPATTIVNSGAAGDKKAEVILNPTAKLVNDSGDPLAQADVLGPCYWTDNQTVCKTSTGKSLAGTLLEIDPDGGVWIELGVATGIGAAGPQGAQGAQGPQGA